MLKHDDNPPPPGGTPPARRWKRGAAFGAVAAVLLVSAVVAGLRHLGPPEPPARATAAADPVRKEGDWAVTALGQLQFSWYLPKGNRLLVHCKGKPPELWDTERGERVALLREHPGDVGAADLSPEGDRFVTASEPGDPGRAGGGDSRFAVRVWETASGRLLQRIDLDPSAEGVSGSTEWVVRWRGEGELFLQLQRRRSASGPPLHTVFGRVDVGAGRVVQLSEPLRVPEYLFLSPDRKRAAATAEYGAYRGAAGHVGRVRHSVVGPAAFLDMERFRVLRTLDPAGPAAGAERPTVLNAAWSADGRRLATVGSDHAVAVRDGRTGGPVSVLRGHTDWVVGVAFSGDGERVITASEDKTARVWEAATGRQVALLTGHTEGLTDAALGGDGDLALTGGEDQTARLWDGRTGRPLRAWPEHESGVRRVAFDPDGVRVYTQTAKGVERYWSLRDGSLLAEIKPPEPRPGAWPGEHGVCHLRERGGLTEVWVGPPGASPPGEAEHRLRALGLGALLAPEALATAGMPAPAFSLKGFQGSGDALALAPDGRTVALAATGDAVVVWRPAEWDRVTGRGRLVLAPKLLTECLAFSPDGRTLATGHPDGTVRLWDPAGCKVLQSRSLHRGAVQALAFTAAGRSLVSCSFDNAAKRFEAKGWEVAGGGERVVAAGEASVVWAVALAADARLLALSYQVGDVHRPDQPSEVGVWDVASGRRLHRLRGHTACVMAVAFSPDGRSLASGGVDNTVRVWDTASGQERSALSAGPSASESVESLAFSADGRVLASGNWYGEITLWDPVAGRERGTLRAHPRGRHVTVLVCSRDGALLASGGSDGTIKLWRLADLLDQSGGGGRANFPPDTRHPELHGPR